MTRRGRPNVATIVETAYRAAVSDREHWLERVVDVAAPMLDRGAGTFAYEFKLGVRSRVALVDRVALLARGTTTRVAADPEVVAVTASGAGDPNALDALSEAEREVARLAARGTPNAAIAKKRGVALRTVANQLASIFRKLDVSSRAELATLVSR